MWYMVYSFRHRRRRRRLTLSIYIYYYIPINYIIYYARRRGRKIYIRSANATSELPRYIILYKCVIYMWCVCVCVCVCVCTSYFPTSWSCRSCSPYSQDLWERRIYTRVGGKLYNLVV